jgi:hypothetical protein
MTWAYVVTFEFQSEPPVTFRGTVDGGTLSTATNRAVRAARKQAGVIRPAGVVVLVERAKQAITAAA